MIPLRERLRRQLVSLIRDCDLLARDIREANRGTLAESPMDIGPEVVIAGKARQALAALDRGDMKEHARLTDQLGEYADSFAQ